MPFNPHLYRYPSRRSAVYAAGGVWATPALADGFGGRSVEKRVFLIVHGFAGSLRETGPLEEFLRIKGFDTYAPLLSGHGKGKKELGGASHRDWLKDVERAYDKLSAEYETITLIGFSMGGLLCANIADRPKVDSVVFINTPVYVWNLRVIAGDVFSALSGGGWGKITGYYGRALTGASLKSGVDFLGLLTKAGALLRRVSKPALILQCVNDETVWPESALYIKRKLSGPAKLKFYNGGCHQVLFDARLKNRVIRDIYKFIGNHNQKLI